MPYHPDPTEREPAAKPRLLDQVRQAIRTRHYSPRTEKAYVRWIIRFILFHGKRHADELGASEIERFLSSLATRSNVSASTQNQALSALLFLYKEVLGRELEWLSGVVRAKRPVRLPVVLSREEVRALLGHMHGTPWLMASLLYGSGLRLLECCRLRVKDVDFGRCEITVRDGKGGKDRVTLLPLQLKEPLAAHLERVRMQHQVDLRKGAGSPVTTSSPMRCESSIRGLRGSCPGSGSFRPRAFTSRGTPVSVAAITSTSRSSSGP
jgi:integrase